MKYVSSDENEGLLGSLAIYGAALTAAAVVLIGLPVYFSAQPTQYEKSTQATYNSSPTLTQIFAARQGKTSFVK